MALRQAVASAAVSREAGRRRHRLGAFSFAAKILADFAEGGFYADVERIDGICVEFLLDSRVSAP
jgi:hypothetical protein